MRRLIFRSAYKKDLKKIKNDRSLLKDIDDVVRKLLDDVELDPKNKDHSLNDNRDYKGCRECHIRPDWLLIYRKSDSELILELLRTGNHNNLFESTANSNGIYSLKSGWLKIPVKDDIPDNIDLQPELSEWVRRSEDCNSIDSIDNFMDDIYKLRQESILTDGEYGKGNQIFKELRNQGVLQDLKDKKIELENKDMSLEESLEPISKGTTQLYGDLLNAFEEIASLENNIKLADEVRKQKSMISESLEEDELNETVAKLKDKYNRTLDWYHRCMEKGSLPGEYDRNNPIINEDLIARASNKFGFSSDKLRRALRGEDIWK